VSLLTRTEFQPLLNSGGLDQIYIEPILEDDQIGSISIDLRLGTDFLVSVLSRKSTITLSAHEANSGAEQFFQTARRDIGDAFIIYPAQTVLTTTIEYLGLPANVYADVVARSSYNRLGLGLHSTFQPGFRGCVSVELHNHSNVPVELLVGCRIVQARFFRISNPEQYFSQNGERRKYVGHVRPVVSRAGQDADLTRLQKLAKY
jgi:dCTP deaminase